MVQWKRLLVCALLTASACARAGAQTLTWTGASNQYWSNAGNWTPSAAPSAGDVLIFSGTPTLFTSDANVSLDFSSISFGALNQTMTLSTSNSSAITIDSGDTVSFADGNAVVINVEIQGAGGLTMSNVAETGNVILGANNQYFGPTLVNYGTLQDGEDNAYSPQSMMEVGLHGTLDVNYNESVAGLFNGVGGGGSVSLNGASLVITASSNFSGSITGPGSLYIGNGARFDVQGNFNYSGTTTIDAASILAIDDGGNLSPATLVTGLGTLEFDNTGPINFGSVISGSVGVLQAEAGTTTFTAPSSYDSDTVIDAGAVTDAADNVFSPNSMFRLGSGATVDIEHNETLEGFGNDGPGQGIIFIGSTGTLNLTANSFGVESSLQGTGNLNLSVEGASLTLLGTANNSFSGNIFIGGDTTLTIGDGGLGAATIAGNGSLVFQNGANILVSAILGTNSEENFDVTLNGGGKATLLPAAANNYSGDTYIHGSTLADGQDNAFSHNSTVNIDQGGTLEADFNDAVGGLADGQEGGSEFVTIAAGKTLTLNLTDDSDPIFSGRISGNGSLKVDGDGSGTEQLSGVNTYTGGTTVANAELDLSGGSINHPAANLVVADGTADNGYLLLENSSSITDQNGTIGNQSGSVGTVVINDAGSSWTNNGTLTVGNAGNGDLQINNGGQVSDVDAFVGNSSGSGLVQVLGGTWTSTGAVVIGNGGSGTVDLASGGTLNIQNGSGTLTLGNSTTGAALIIGEDDNNGVDPNSGGVLDAAVVAGASPLTTIDDLIFNATGSSESPYYFTNTRTQLGTPIEIDGNIHVAIENAPVVLSNAFSTYAGGTNVLNYSGVIIGASSTGSPDNPTSGPIGTGILTLGDFASLDVTQSNLTLANTINLSINSESTSDLGNSSSPDNLTLSGTISGRAQLEWLGSGVLTLSNDASTFSGVYVSKGTLNLTTSTIGGNVEVPPTSGPAGTGTISLDDGSSLTRPNGASITITNPIQLANEDTEASIAGDQTGLLTLGGSISDAGGGRLDILSPVDLTGVDQVTRTFVEGTTLTVESDTGVEAGILVGETAATINFPTDNPNVGTMILSDSTINFTAGDGGEPVLTSVSMTNSTINFADDSNPKIEGLQDSMGSTNAIHLNGSDLELIFDNSAEGTINYYGTIDGGGTVDIGGIDFGSVVQLNGNNTYTGHTTIENDNVGIAGSSSAFSTGTLYMAANSALVVNSGVTLPNQIMVQGDGIFLGGFGTLAPTSTPNITIQNGSVIAGGTGALSNNYDGITGNAVGTLTFAPTTSITLAQAGVLQFSVMNDSGTPGTDYSAINVNGTLNIDSSTAGSHFVIQVVGVDGTGPFDTMNSMPVSFDFNSPHSWTLLTAGTIVNPGGVFDPTDFTVDSSTDFSGGTGLWSVSEIDNSLDLNFTPVPEPSPWALLGAGTALLGLVARRRAMPRLTS